MEGALQRGDRTEHLVLIGDQLTALAARLGLTAGPTVADTVDRLPLQAPVGA